MASQWETQGTGPAKRVYQLTEEGMEALASWVGYMHDQAQRLSGFVQAYREIK